MKYYLVDFTGLVYFKTFTNGQDINQVVKNYMKEQNSGQAKSDRLFLKSIKKITEGQFKKHHWPCRNLTGQQNLER